MRLILARHGETAWNKEGRFQGQSLVGLNEQGAAQVKKLAKALLPMKPTALYFSPLPRTCMTAQEVSRELSIPAEPLEGIREIDLGELEGITGQEMRTRYPGVYATWRRDPSDVVFPGGESIRQLQERAWSAIQGVEKAHSEDAIVAVSHNFAIRTILCSFLGLPLSRFHLLRVDLASISILQTNSRSRQVLSINDRCHLSQDELRDG
jgi:broad specificity phosphatase PhoE